jgi:hypothetical protein
MSQSATDNAVVSKGELTAKSSKIAKIIHNNNEQSQFLLPYLVFIPA